eukprot:7198112-Heterocapsa_arctica.AAC.1
MSNRDASFSNFRLKPELTNVLVPHAPGSPFASRPDCAQGIPKQGHSRNNTKFAKKLLHKLSFARSSVQCDQLRFA